MAGLVSVVMPVYNGEAYIAEAIESVISQGYPHWELVIVDDGSTDHTPDILRQYPDPRITVIRQENRGEAGARNTGLDHASGQYIGFLDADDMFLPTALEDLATFLDTHQDADIVFADANMIDASGAHLMRLSELRAVLHTGYILEPLVLQSTVVSVPMCMMVRKSAIDARHTRFDENLRYGVDWDFWTELARFHRFGYLPSPVGCYRVHTANMTSSVSSRRRKDDLAVGRLKIMHSHWFNDLSTSTRVDFVRGVVHLLEGQSLRQREIFAAPAFVALPADARSRIYQRTAQQYILARQELGFAAHCLEQSLLLWPANRKSRLLLDLLRAYPGACRVLLLAWQKLHQAYTAVRSVNRAKPKPVPRILMPRQ